MKIAAFALALLSCVAAAAADVAPVRVLIWSGRNNHNWQETTPFIKQTLEACPRFSPVDVTDDPAKCDAATLAKYDVIVCNWTQYPETKREWPEATEQGFVDWMKKGGGFVVIHAATCSFHDWPEFQQLIGVTWFLDKASHTKYHEFQVDIVDNEHPITKGMKPFKIKDELYQNLTPIAPVQYKVLCQAFAAPDQKGTGRNEPMLLVTSLEKGRGANIVLGHDVPAMKHEGFINLLLRTTEWAATGDVTIK
jgi:type 1 glutamine amidotransferase